MDGHAGPPADDLGDLFLRDLFPHQPALGGRDLRLRLLQLGLELGKATVLELRGAVQVVVPLRLLDVEAQSLQLLP